MISNAQIMNAYNAVLRNKLRDDVCMTWAFKQRDICILNLREMAIQLDNWNNVKNANVKAEHYNCKTFEVEGKSWYVMIVQFFNDNDEMIEELNPMCPMSMFLFNTWVSGLTYAFEDKQTRDDFVYYLNHKKSHPMIIGKILLCCLCNCICENEFGNNAYPLNENDRCCDKCNLSKVLPARLHMFKKEGEEKIKKQKEAEAKKKELELKAKLDAKQAIIAEKTSQELLKGETKVKMEHKQKKDKKLTQAEETRNANKKQQEEKKKRQEYEKRVAECAKLLQQQKGKKGKK